MTTFNDDHAAILKEFSTDTGPFRVTARNARVLAIAAQAALDEIDAQRAALRCLTADNEKLREQLSAASAALPTAVKQQPMSCNVKEHKSCWSFTSIAGRTDFTQSIRESYSRGHVQLLSFAADGLCIDVAEWQDGWSVEALVRQTRKWARQQLEEQGAVRIEVHCVNPRDIE